MMFARKPAWRTISVFVFLLPLLGVSTHAATISGLVGQVSQSQYETYQVAVERMGLGLYNAAYNQTYRSRDGSSSLGDLGNQEARLYLSDRFTAMGLDVSIQGTYRNVVGELPGTTTPNDIYIVSGHYDTTAGSSGNERPGGDDNASGTAGVLEAARVLSQYPFESTIRFIGFNAEEDGLWGSQNYVTTVVQAGGENVVGVINMDMILRPAWDNNGAEPSDLDVVTAPSGACSGCGAWANIYIAAANTYVPSLVIDPASPNSSGTWGASDHKPFASAGYPALLAVENTADEVWGGSNDYYHGSQDASDLLANVGAPSGVTYDYPFAANTVAATVATIVQEAVLVPEPHSLMLAVIGMLGLLAVARRRRPS